MLLRKTGFAAVGLASAVALVAGSALAGTPLGSTFTYQGRLMQSGQPFDGTIDRMTFRLFDDAERGGELGEERFDNVPVTDGLFTVTLNNDNRFGDQAFNGDSRWLEIEIDEAGQRARLSPRQPILGTPYAIQTRGLFVDKARHVGIGTTKPEADLHVNGTTRTNILQIVGGADVAEPFDIGGSVGGGAGVPPVPAPGMVVCIDPQKPGELMLSATAYDRKVAGVISGANGVNPGLTLQQENSVANGRQPVALTGRVYCWVDADANGAVQPGDLLTTSDTAGHAMKVTDHERAQGAVIGKAMSELRSGTGLVLVLVNLQ
jgi:hypothetical protein